MVLFLLLSKALLGLIASFSYHDAQRIFPYTKAYMGLAMPRYNLPERNTYHRYDCIVSHDDNHGFNFYFHRNRILVGVLWAPRADKTTCFAELREWYKRPIAAVLTDPEDTVAWCESAK